MKIHICNRMEVTSGLPSTMPPTLLISIRDHGMEPIKPCFQPDAAIYLEFNDVDEQGEHPMKLEDAAAIWKFLFQHARTDKQVIVQCEGGVSRSAAIAKAIRRCRGLDWSMFDRPPYHPNAYCFGLMMKAAGTWEGSRQQLC